jgi:hypothetical protein
MDWLIHFDDQLFSVNFNCSNFFGGDDENVVVNQVGY